MRMKWVYGESIYQTFTNCNCCSCEFIFFLSLGSGSYRLYFWCTGHYIPQLAIAILDHNERSTGFKFNLKAVAVRGPHIILNSLLFHDLYTCQSSIWVLQFVILLTFAQIYANYMIRLGIHCWDLIVMLPQHMNTFGLMEWFQMKLALLSWTNVTLMIIPTQVLTMNPSNATLQYLKQMR